MQPSTPAKSAYVACSLIVLVALALSAVSQRSLTAENGLGWDGSQYARMTSQCWHETISAFEPFVYRIGAPCIAALLPGTPKASLFTLNLAASILFMFLLTAWLRRFVPDTIVAWLVAGMAMHWLGPLRYTWWYPTYVDPLALCAIVGGLLLRDRAVAFVVVCAAGTFVRETMLVVPAALAIGRCVAIARGGAGSSARLVRSLRNDTRFRNAVAGSVAGGASLLIAHTLVTPASDYRMADSAFYWAYAKPLPSYVLAWFITFGPMLALPLERPRVVFRFLAASPEYLILLVSVACLAWVGGSDTERFLVWSAPVALLLVAVTAADVNWHARKGPLVLLCLGQILNGRWFFTTPTGSIAALGHAWPILTPLRAHRVEDLLSLTPDRVAGTSALIQYTVLTLTLLLWLRRRAA